jgi:hypothetical protein
MIPTIDTCEWNPGANRSIVSIEIASQNVRSEDRSLLVAKFNKKSFDDLVEIRKDRISGQKNQYDATLSNMNFARNRLCHHITRQQWKEETVVSAMVFSVNGRSYGYASVCGNLFELTQLPPEKHEHESIPESPPSIERVFESNGPTTIIEGGQSFTEYYQGTAYGGYSDYGSSYYGGVWGGGYYGGGSGTVPNSTTVDSSPTPTVFSVSPVPELPIWECFGIGSAFLILRRKHVK